MTRYDYTADMTEHGKFVLQVEAELEVQVSAGAEFDLTVTAVFVNGVDLLQSSNSAFVALGIEISSMAEVDAAFVSTVMAGENVAFIGRGALDPDARFSFAGRAA
ncbi:hypothetical protein SAMN02745157_4831 [Kaistia soli DSM 19436]|uniref:Uncharacterized protein n=1 Tax=Kaistia soli DSM 19436 TaxID=1122133 RepID=A0A1M5MMX2_9HYPH|nr:hypothetical protein [Kaistia soli]SHG78740.1 hypothetical protein SAMN02745157_4831 [Kaistia soli DSM 19436]